MRANDETLYSRRNTPNFKMAAASDDPYAYKEKMPQNRCVPECTKKIYEEN